MTAVNLGMPGHFSYSALSSYMQCGKSYELQRIRKVPEIPAWWFVGGSAVHALTEQWDRENFPDSGLDQLWQEAFDKEFEERKAKFPDLKQWRAGGKRSKANPDGEDYLRWMELGPQFVRNYITWRERTQWELWAPNGEPAIECMLDFEVGDWRLRGAIDRVFIFPATGELVVTDIKTGSRMPDNDLQLGCYAVGMELQYGIRPTHGMYYNPRLGKPSQLFELAKFTPGYLAAMGSQLRSGIQAGVFLPHVTNLCDYCSVNHGCASYGGKLAHLYDPMHSNYQGDSK